MEFHFKASLLLLSVFPLLSLGQLPSSASKSYLSNDSYSLYPPWLVVDEGRLEFSFKTSHRNGLLLYFDSNAEFVGEFFKLSLVNGVLTAESITTTFRPVQVSIGNQHLNDNQVHTVAVDHIRSNNRFTIQLDQLQSVPIDYILLVPGSSNHIGESGLYFGGVPENFPFRTGSSAPSDPHFIGCIMNVQYSNDSTQPADLFEAFPQEEVSVTAGCVDPCEEVECGDGVCVPSFPVGICDCRGTNKLGANCTEDPATHARTFTSGGAYLCYDVIREPRNGEQTETSVTLIPPIPLYGTIITVSSSSGLFYSVSLEDGRVVQTLSRNHTTVVVSRGSLPLTTASIYKIDVSVNRTYIFFTVYQQLEGEVFSKFDYKESAIVPELSSGPDFEHVCLGGVILEGENYVGTIESAYSDYFSLTEERNFELLRTNETERSNLINFDGLATLSFQKFHTNAVRFSFDKRTDVSTEIFSLENDNGETLSLSLVGNNPVAIGTEIFIPCEYNVQDDQWHHYEVFITRGPVASISYTIDCTQECQILNNVSTARIEGFFNNPIQFAAAHPSDGPTTPFQGCLQNFVFEQSDGKLLQPNLEVLARIGNDFSTSTEGCDQCTQDVGTCTGTCLNRDFMRGDECNPVDEISPFECLATQSTTASTQPTTTPTQPTPTEPTTTPTQPTPTEPTTTHTDTNAPPTPTALEVGTWVGIGIGIFLAVILIVVIIILGVVLFGKRRAGQGFYKTYETNAKNPQVIHYSASLKELSSEDVIETNGQIPSPNAVQCNGHSNKEFYL